VPCNQVRYPAANLTCRDGSREAAATADSDPEPTKLPVCLLSVTNEHQFGCPHACTDEPTRDGQLWASSKSCSVVLGTEPMLGPGQPQQQAAAMHQADGFRRRLCMLSPIDASSCPPFIAFPALARGVEKPISTSCDPARAAASTRAFSSNGQAHYTREARSSISRPSSID
jgi:hypothetical protein